MKNIFNEADKNELLERIARLQPSATAAWGQMNATQMLAHCTEGLKMSTGELQPKRVPFPISLIGRLVKNTALGSKDFKRNAPTAPELKITVTKDIEQEKSALAAAVNKVYASGTGGVKAEAHPFFGKLTKQEWGRLNYKHLDHHLKQFGA